MKSLEQKKVEWYGNRTHVCCLEGSNANHYTNHPNVQNIVVHRNKFHELILHAQLAVSHSSSNH